MGSTTTTELNQSAAGNFTWGDVSWGISDATKELTISQSYSFNSDYCGKYLSMTAIMEVYSLMNYISGIDARPIQMLYPGGSVNFVQIG